VTVANENEFLGADQPQQVAESGQQPTEAVSVPPKPEGMSKTDYAELLEAITNQEGKPKYKSVSDALIGAAKAQEHIARLEAENAEFRANFTKAKTGEELLKELESERKRADQPVPKVEDQESMILSVLEKREAALREKGNREAVLSTLKNKYGDKLESALQSKAEDLGLTVAELGSLAARSPKAVLAYFDAKATGTPTVKGTVNTEALQPVQKGPTVPENIMWGASTQDRINLLREIRADVEKQLGLN